MDGCLDVMKEVIKEIKRKQSETEMKREHLVDYYKEIMRQSRILDQIGKGYYNPRASSAGFYFGGLVGFLIFNSRTNIKPNGLRIIGTKALFSFFGALISYKLFTRIYSKSVEYKLFKSKRRQADEIIDQYFELIKY